MAIKYLNNINVIISSNALNLINVKDDGLYASLEYAGIDWVDKCINPIRPLFTFRNAPKELTLNITMADTINSGVSILSNGTNDNLTGIVLTPYDAVNIIDNNINYSLSDVSNIRQWSSTINYSVNDYVFGSDNNMYKAVKASGPLNGGPIDPKIYTGSLTEAIPPGANPPDPNPVYTLSSSWVLFENNKVGFIKITTGKIPSGYLPLTGLEFKRNEFPLLWNYIQASGMVVNEDTWQNNKWQFSTGISRSYPYTYDTFRLPLDESGISYIRYI